MHTSGGGHNGSRLEDQLRLVIVESPHAAAPLIGALEVADVGAWMWVEAERALYFSPRVLELLGLAAEPRQDLLTRFSDCVHPDEREKVGRMLRGEVPAGPYKARYRFIPPGGPLRWIEDRGRVERDPSGVLIRQGGAMRDVTDEVGRELERREADARLEALVNAMPFAVWGRSGTNLTVTHQNAQAVARWGDLRGRAFADAHPAVRAEWEAHLADAMTGQVVRTRRDEVVDGEHRTFDHIIAPVIVGDRVTGVVGAAIDVTDEARTGKVQALLTEMSADFAGRSTEALDAGLVAALGKIGRWLGAPVAVLCEVIDSHGEQQARVTHWWVDRAIGLERPRLTEFDPRHIGSWLQRIAENTPVVLHTRDELPEDSPERAWLASIEVESLAMVPARQLDGRHTLLGVSGALDQRIDWPPETVSFLRLASTLLGAVLARARADANQKAVERRMQEAQRLESLGVLAGGIAHDFNNLLTAILGNASLLRAEHGEVAGMSEGLDQIEGASRRAAELCRQMLAFAGRGRFALQSLDVNAIVRDMQPLIQVTVPKKARLVLDLADSLPPVLADAAQLRQLLMNLILNAAEALEDAAGTIALRTAAGHRTSDQLSQTVFTPPPTPGDYVSVVVTDTGTGMTAETIGRIFDPFFSTKFTGRGLGLAAVVGIVRAHNGALHVHSEPGTGSTFELLLPAQQPAIAPPPEAVSAATHASSRAWRTTGTALVVDDEAGVRDLVRSVLERAGMTVVLADNGESGVARFGEIVKDVRVVLVDYAMPGLDGNEALAAMRELQPDLPAIVMSGYTPADIANASSHIFLQKPFTPAALREAVQRALGERDDVA
jgi:signal transduction histidine kinase/PAS domain-containing protein